MGRIKASDAVSSSGRLACVLSDRSSDTSLLSFLPLGPVPPLPSEQGLISNGRSPWWLESPVLFLFVVIGVMALLLGGGVVVRKQEEAQSWRSWTVESAEKVRQNLP